MQRGKRITATFVYNGEVKTLSVDSEIKFSELKRKVCNEFGFSNQEISIEINQHVTSKLSIKNDEDVKFALTRTNQFYITSPVQESALPHLCGNDLVVSNFGVDLRSQIRESEIECEVKPNENNKLSPDQASKEHVLTGIKALNITRPVRESAHLPSGRNDLIVSGNDKGVSLQEVVVEGPNCDPVCLKSGQNASRAIPDLPEEIVSFSQYSQRETNASFEENMPSIKMAFLVGNYDYDNLPKLTAPKNDIIKLYNYFSENSFEVFSFLNLSKDGIIKAISLFCNMLKRVENVYVCTCMVGHGFQEGNFTYMLCIDSPNCFADMPSKSLENGFVDLAPHCISTYNILSRILKQNPDACSEMISLCRTSVSNDFVVFPCADDELKVYPYKDNLVQCFSAKKGERSFEERNKNSILVREFLKVVHFNPRISLRDLFAKLKEWKQGELSFEVISYLNEMVVSFSDTTRPDKLALKVKEELTEVWGQNESIKFPLGNTNVTGVFLSQFSCGVRNVMEISVELNPGDVAQKLNCDLKLIHNHRHGVNCFTPFFRNNKRIYMWQVPKLEELEEELTVWVICSSNGRDLYQKKITLLRFNPVSFQRLKKI